jgi:hypothetical protein
MAATVLLGVLAVPTAALGAPAIDYALSGTAGDDGWYRGPVTITWTIAGATDIDCLTVETLRADTPGAARTCKATDGEGASASLTTKAIKIDQTPPASVVGLAARPPDHGLFYTAPVAVAFSGADATSGVVSCTSATYGGPDAPSATVSGTCRDRAGNASALVPSAFAYDATAPALTGVGAVVGADRRATVTWTPAPDAQTVTVVRDVPAATLLDHVPAAARSVIDGPLAPGSTTIYTVTVADAAGNATSATATAAVPVATLAAKGAKGGKGASTSTKLPTLRWRAHRPAKYYNFQLFRNGRKILSAWPRGTHYTLRAKWRYHHKTYKLTAGRYRWYVWPGYGPRAQHRYGRLHAKGAVTYPAPPTRDGGQ